MKILKMLGIAVVAMPGTRRRDELQWLRNRHPAHDPGTLYVERIVATTDGEVSSEEAHPSASLVGTMEVTSPWGLGAERLQTQMFLTKAL